ncbi:hypothetical protein EVAR_31415_1 [Eumeta japonica]|uniref:Retrotransposon gag domain-containing protein n=1 Tax=Eumeta variegata TaxID=151549 RepID=A0A4C1UYH5_EUMVA|nr:hypothetical protein EVAR_31415_1 [Eumeta japonica]
MTENPLQGATLVIALSKALKGSAATWLSQVSFTGITWELFKEVFLARYDSVETSAATLIIINNSRPMEGEFLSAYENRLMTTLTSRWTKLNPKEIEIAVSFVLAHIAQFDSRIRRLAFTTDNLSITKLQQDHIVAQCTIASGEVANTKAHAAGGSVMWLAAERRVDVSELKPASGTLTRFATVEFSLLLQYYLSGIEKIEWILIMMLGLITLRTMTILMVVRMFNSELINDYISVITEIDETLGTSSFKSTDRSLMRLLVLIWSLALTKFVFDFEIIFSQNAAIVMVHNINNFQLYSSGMTFFYYLSLLTLRLKALKKYVGVDDILIRDTEMTKPQLILSEEFIKNEFAYYSKLNTLSLIPVTRILKECWPATLTRDCLRETEDDGRDRRRRCGAYRWERGLYYWLPITSSHNFLQNVDLCLLPYKATYLLPNRVLRKWGVQWAIRQQSNPSRDC